MKKIIVSTILILLLVCALNVNADAWDYRNAPNRFFDNEISLAEPPAVDDHSDSQVWNQPVLLFIQEALDGTYTWNPIRMRETVTVEENVTTGGDNVGVLLRGVWKETQDVALSDGFYAVRLSEVHRDNSTFTRQSSGPVNQYGIHEKGIDGKYVGEGG